METLLCSVRFAVANERSRSEWIPIDCGVDQVACKIQHRDLMHLESEVNWSGYVADSRRRFERESPP